MTQRVTQPRVPYRDRQQRIGERLRSVAEVEPSGELLARVTRLTGARPVGWVSRPGGFTPTERWSLDLADGRWVFAKRATRDWLAEALRIEYRNLGLIDADFRCCDPGVGGRRVSAAAVGGFAGGALATTLASRRCRPRTRDAGAGVGDAGR